MRKIILAVAGLVFTALIAGCGTLFTGSTAELTFTTDPADAAIYLDDRFIGKGSATVTLSRSMANGTPTVRVERKGYKTQEFRLRTKLNSVSLFNLTLAPSWTTDFVSGAMFEYEPDKYHVQLQRNDTASLSVEQRVAHYVAIHSLRFRRDLAAGGGETLDSLVEFVAHELGADSNELRNSLISERDSLTGIDAPLALARAVNAIVHRAQST